MVDDSLESPLCNNHAPVASNAHAAVELTVIPRTRLWFEIVPVTEPPVTERLYDPSPVRELLSLRLPVEDFEPVVTKVPNDVNVVLNE